MSLCVLLCFIEPIVGNRGPGDSEPGDTWISLNNHLNYVAGSIGHHLPHLRTDPATNAVDNQGPALAAPCLGKCESSHGKFQSLNSKLAPTLATKPEKKSRYTFSIKERHYRLICKISRKKQKNTKGICHSVSFKESWRQLLPAPGPA